MPNYITAVGAQQYSVTIPSGATSGTATISSVGAGGFIFPGGINPTTSNNPAVDFCYTSLTNPTTITVARSSGATGSIAVNGCIVDGDTSNLIKSIQQGTVTIAAGTTTGTATISAVNNNNTATHLMGWTTTNAAYSGINENPLVSLAGTTVTATALGTAGTRIVGYQITEFQSGALNQSVQNIVATTSANTAVYTATINSVNTNNTICIYAGSAISGVTTNPSQIKQYLQLTNATTVTVTAATTVANMKTCNFSVVEFVNGVLDANVQRSITSISGASGSTSLSPSVNTSRSILSWLGNSTSQSSAALQNSELKGKLNSASVGVTRTSGVVVGLTLAGSWETAEFTAFSIQQTADAIWFGAIA